MNKALSVLFLIIMSWGAKAQDERYFRQLFSGELSKETHKIDERRYSYYIHTPYYALDLNRDGQSEHVLFVKKDSEDWIEIFDNDKNKIFAYQFENKGYDSELFRIELKTLSPNTSILLLYYYEGISRYINFQGTSSLYAVTIDNNDLKTLKSFKGPSFFDEVKTLKKHYHKRFYEVYLEDLNHDSSKELVIRHRNASTVFLYKGEGKWQTLRQ